MPREVKRLAGGHTAGRGGAVTLAPMLRSIPSSCLSQQKCPEFGLESGPLVFDL